MATTQKLNTYAASATITLGLAGTPLASSSGLTAGRQSTAVDNTSNLYLDALVSGKVTTGTSPTVSTFIEIWAYAAIDDAPTYPDTITGSDGDVTITSLNVKNSALALLRTITIDNTSNRTYYWGPCSIAQAFGQMPRKWGLFVVHNTGVALNSTAGNHQAKYDGILTQSV